MFLGPERQSSEGDGWVGGWDGAEHGSLPEMIDSCRPALCHLTTVLLSTYTGWHKNRVIGQC